MELVLPPNYVGGGPVSYIYLYSLNTLKFWENQLKKHPVLGRVRSDLKPTYTLSNLPQINKYI